MTRRQDDRQKAREMLASIDPRNLTYEEWLKVGMALHHAGCSAADWEGWSAGDQERFNAGECARKWAGFRGGGGKPVTLGSLSRLAGRVSKPPRQGYGWDDAIEIRGERPPVDPAWVEESEIPPAAADWKPGDMIRYLEAMYEPDEKVGIVAESWLQESSGRWLPKKGVWDRTAGKLVDELRACGGDPGKVIGDWRPECGAWVRINPLDGNGCRDENVTSFRHALIEADEDDLGKQLAIIRELELPCTCIVHSGGKSLHALVRVDAADMTEYRQRVDRLYEVARRSGLKVDTQNRNPSRLSRIPGVDRGGRPQYIVSVRCGKPTWDAWEEHIDELSDDLPDPEPLAAVFEALPPLAPELIHGLLRCGHKLRMTGASKAGKSFALIELAIAIAEGREWMGRQCRQGGVLYINLELDRASLLNRFADVYRALGWRPDAVSAIQLWNLRGHAVPLDKLVPKMIRRARGWAYSAVIIDPIYKVLTGDENSAEDMAAFCNQFDRVCHALGAATIDAHHHSKGAQGQKRSLDRGSGSGVFARDPDAILDFIELDVSGPRREQLVEAVGIDALKAAVAAVGGDWESTPVEDRGPLSKALRAAQVRFPAHQQELAAAVALARQHAGWMSGWRLEATAREFPPPEPSRIWFRYPVHRPDEWGLLKDAKAEGEEPPWMADRRLREEVRREKSTVLKMELDVAIEEAGGPGKAKVADVAEMLGIGDEGVRKRLRDGRQFRSENGIICARTPRVSPDATTG